MSRPKGQRDEHARLVHAPAPADGLVQQLLRRHVVTLRDEHHVCGGAHSVASKRRFHITKFIRFRSLNPAKLPRDGFVDLLLISLQRLPGSPNSLGVRHPAQIATRRRRRGHALAAVVEHVPIVDRTIIVLVVIDDDRLRTRIVSVTCAAIARSPRYLARSLLLLALRPQSQVILTLLAIVHLPVVRLVYLT